MDLKKAAENPAHFRTVVRIDHDGEAVPFGDVMDPWQRADFEAMDPAWLKVAGRSSESPKHKNAFLERARGHSKSCDLAIMCTWALFSSPRDLCGIAVASHRDQAKLLRNAIERLLRMNSWLAEALTVLEHKVVNRHTGSELTVMAADVPGSYGVTPDFLALDEVCHWPSGKGEAMWTSLLSASAKRRDCVVTVISNAGTSMGTGWVWNAREKCRESESWYFSRLDGPVASWITQDHLDEQRSLLPPKAFKRLWLNEWQTESGDAIDLEDIEACITRDAPPIRVHCSRGPFIGGLDLGLKNDHSALVVLQADVPLQRVSLISCESWAPPKRGGQVRLEDVKAACIAAHRRYNLSDIIFDPWQAMLMAQQLANEGVSMRECTQTSVMLDRMAMALLQTFRNRQLDLYEDKALIRDLTRLTIVEKQNGQYKLQSTRDEHGHCDRATALSLALISAVDTIEYLRNQPPDPCIQYEIVRAG